MVLRKVGNEDLDMIDWYVLNYTSVDHNEWAIKRQLTKVVKHYKGVTGHMFRLKNFGRWKLQCVLDVLAFCDSHNIDSSNFDTNIEQHGLLAILIRELPRYTKENITNAIRYIQSRAFVDDVEETNEEFVYPWPPKF